LSDARLSTARAGACATATARGQLSRAPPTAAGARSPSASPKREVRRGFSIEALRAEAPRQVDVEVDDGRCEALDDEREVRGL
jgi:hypothetical protein